VDVLVFLWSYHSVPKTLIGGCDSYIVVVEILVVFTILAKIAKNNLRRG